MTGPLHHKTRVLVRIIAGLLIFHAGNVPAAQAADNADDFFLFLSKNKNYGWTIQKQIDGSQTLQARRNASRPHFCIDARSDGGISNDPAVRQAFAKIIRAYVEATVGKSIEEGRKVVEYGCSYNNLLLVRRGQLEATVANADRRSANLAEYDVLGVIDIASINSEISALKLAAQQLENAEKEKFNELLQLANTDSRAKVYYLQLHTNYNGGIPFSRGACTLKAYGNRKSGDGAVVYSLYEKNSFDRQSQSNGRGFSIFYESINDLYVNFDKEHGIFSKNGSGACTFYLDFAKNIYLLKSALERDHPNQRFSILGYDAGEILAAANGFETAAEYAAAEEMGVTSTGLKALADLGIRDVPTFRAKLREMSQSGYSGDETAGPLLQYLRDKLEGEKSGKTAVQVRAERDRRLVAEEAKKKSAAAAALAQRNAEFPYYAIFTCGIGNGHMAIAACFGDTELEIRNGSDYGAYNRVRIVNGGVPHAQETEGGFVVDLRSTYSIRAQNSNQTNILLGLSVFRRGSSTPIFSKEVGGFGVIITAN